MRLEYRGAPIESIDTRKTTELVTTDPEVCAPNLRTQLVLTVESADGALVQSAPYTFTALQHNVAKGSADLSSGELVAPGVRLNLTERFENGIRSGRLVAFREERTGRGEAAGQVTTIAQWRVEAGQ